MRLAEVGGPGLKPSTEAASIRGLAKGTALLVAATLLQRSGTFVGNALAARIAGPERFGFYVLACQTATLLSGYAGMSMGTVSTKFGANIGPSAAQEARRAAARGLIVFLIVAVAGASLMGILAGHAVLSDPSNVQGIGLLLSVSLLAAVTVLSECMQGLAVGIPERRGSILLGACCGGGAAVLLPVAAAMGSWAMVLAMACASGLGAIAGGTAIWKHVPKGTFSGPLPAALKSARTVYVFAAAQFFAAFSVGTASYLVTLIVARHDTSLRQAGIYASAQQVRNLMLFLPLVVTQASLPSIMRNAASETTSLSTATVSALSCVFAGGGAILSQFLALFYGPGYAPAGQVLCALLCSALAQANVSLLAQRLVAHHSRRLALVNVIWGVSLVACAAALVPTKGAAGAGWSYSIAQLISNCAVLLLSRDLFTSGALAKFYLMRILLVPVAVLISLAVAPAGHASLYVGAAMILIGVFWGLRVLRGSVTGEGGGGTTDHVSSE